MASAGKPKREDFNRLYELYLAAKKSLPEITEGRGGPIYPPAIDAFTEYVRNSVWSAASCDKDQFNHAIQKVSTATFEEIGLIFLGFSMIEHWIPGGWRHQFDNGRLAAVIERASQITNVERVH
jgi:hypothetical protein